MERKKDEKSFSFRFFSFGIKDIIGCNNNFCFSALVGFGETNTIQHDIQRKSVSRHTLLAISICMAVSAQLNGIDAKNTAKMFAASEADEDD